MPVTKSAKRKLKKSLKRRERNLYHLNKLKNTIRLFKKKLSEALSSKNSQDSEALKNELQEELRETISVIDHVAAKGVITKNEASRRKSRITKLFNKVSQKWAQQKSS